MSWIRKLVSLSLIVIAFFAGTALAPRENAVAQQELGPMLVTQLERRLAEVYERVSPSVVSISVEELGRGGDFVPYSSGSGFVVDKAGHIATNYHVVSGGDRVVVNLFDGTIVEADVVGTDTDADIAVLRAVVPEDRLVPVTFGDSERLVIGQMALAIGSPFGQRWTLTSGIISALDRAIEGLSQFQTGAVIQTDTAINPGNSGGPLLNLEGEVIGVNTQILSNRRANSGVGFAVPSNLVKRVVGELIETGEVRYSYLGIQGEDINLRYIEEMDLPNNLRGMVITNVLSGEPAAQAGLNARDIIVAIDGRQVLGSASLIGYVATNTLPGQTVTMTVMRGGDLIDLDLTLGSR